MNCDVASVTGMSHRICEDYARCNVIWRESTKEKKSPPHQLPYIIVADGCSASNDSDFGARLLVKSAENFLGRPNFHTSTIAAARALAQGIGLEEQCLDATLITAQMEVHPATEKEGIFKVVTGTVWGDGVVAGLKKDGTLTISSYSYKPVFHEGKWGTFPNYLSYTLSEGRQQARKDIGASNVYQVDTMHIDKDGKELFRKQTEFETDFMSPRFPAAAYDIACLMTDGVHSFYTLDSGDRKPVDFVTVVRKIMEFRGAKIGDFAQRNMNGLQKAIKANGWQHYDDVSFGAIYLGD